MYISLLRNVTTSQIMAGIYLCFQKMLENYLIIIILEKEKACAPIGMPDLLAFLKGIKKYSVHLMPIWFQNIQRDESIENGNSTSKIERRNNNFGSRIISKFQKCIQM